MKTAYHTPPGPRLPCPAESSDFDLNEMVVPEIWQWQTVQSKAKGGNEDKSFVFKFKQQEINSQMRFEGKNSVEFCITYEDKYN